MTDVASMEERTIEAAPAPRPVPHARWRRHIVRRAVLKRILWGIVAMPIAIVGVQLWHRMMDAYESRPVHAVHPLGSSKDAPAVGTPDFLGALSGITEVTMVPGNHVELLLDGATTLSGIEQDIRSAQRSVVLQTYFCEPGKVTERLKALLMAKAREGVKISFLPDGFGCASLTGEYADSLRAAGVRVAVVRPVKWYSLHRSLHRSHVRSVVIDSRVAYTGGFGFADKWIPSPEGPAWQETTARFTGPAVGQLAGAFAIAWADATGQVLAGDAMFPQPLREEGGAVAGLMFTTRTFGTPVPERFLALALAGARRTAYMANPYFIPNADLRRWFKEAAARGVDVRILTASSNIDVKFTRWAARSTYQELLEGGVRIYEYTPSMLHAKTMVIDRAFGSVGSLNLDNISLRINDEATLMVQDSTLAAALEQRFLADIAKADEVTLEKFRQRPLYEKLTNWAAVLIRNYM
jgi:cardiolipin synthase